MIPLDSNIIPPFFPTLLSLLMAGKIIIRDYLPQHGSLFCSCKSRADLECRLWEFTEAALLKSNNSGKMAHFAWQGESENHPPVCSCWRAARQSVCSRGEQLMGGEWLFKVLFTQRGLFQDSKWFRATVNASVTVPKFIGSIRGTVWEFQEETWLMDLVQLYKCSHHPRRA